VSAVHVGPTPAAAAPPATAVGDRIVVETCRWCGAVPLSCIACVECLQFFCTPACHDEFLHDEEEAWRQRNRPPGAVTEWVH
jgi:hypothetical protein